MKAYQPIVETTRNVTTKKTPAMIAVAIVVFGLLILGFLIPGIIISKAQSFESAALPACITFLSCYAVALIFYKTTRKKSGLADESLAISVKKLTEILHQQPLLMKYFGVLNTDYISPIPETMIGRKLASLLPDDFDKSSLELYQYDGLQYSKAEIVKANYNGTKGGTSGTSILLSPREALISYYEPSALKKYMFRAIANMENSLGIVNHEGFQRILENLNNFVILTQQGNSTMYLTEDDYIDLQLVKQELMRICNALQINYDSMDLGDYRAARSTWLATGSNMLVGFAIGATALSHLNAMVNESLFKDASVYYALNNIVDYFNDKYCMKDR